MSDNLNPKDRLYTATAKLIDAVALSLLSIVQAKFGLVEPEIQHDQQAEPETVTPEVLAPAEEEEVETVKQREARKRRERRAKAKAKKEAEEREAAAAAAAEEEDPEDPEPEPEPEPAPKKAAPKKAAAKKAAAGKTASGGEAAEAPTGPITAQRILNAIPKIAALGHDTSAVGDAIRASGNTNVRELDDEQLEAISAMIYENFEVVC